MNTDTLRLLQKAEYGILKDIDHYCQKYDIKYSLYAGTMLGAVRHKGFIPWDDDIDIAMTREQYIIFSEKWKSDPIPGYYFETCLSDQHTQNVHTKIRKEGTVLLSSVEDEAIGHHGIWIDIFILDKVSKNTIEGKKVIQAGRKLILMAKANGNLPGEKIIKKVARKALRLIYPRARRQKGIDIITNLLEENDKETQDNFEFCDMCTLDYLKMRFPQDTGDKYIKTPFCDDLFPVFANYDILLKTMYGNYMILPPEAEQVCRHNPKKIEF